jgi:hypothetical protein
MIFLTTASTNRASFNHEIKQRLYRSRKNESSTLFNPENLHFYVHNLTVRYELYLQLGNRYAYAARDPARASQV